jgi:peptidyl-tRNA hydrolase, PTH1 family
VKVIVGLGNPGRKYQNTRHNVGFMLVDRLAESAGGQESAFNVEGDSLIQRLQIASHPCLLVKPQTFMNLSGRALAALLRKKYFDPAIDLLVVYDDVALPLGQLRMRANGSAGGHNGMRSIIECLQTTQFPRLRCGIKPETPIVDLAEFVLDRFAASELVLLDHMLQAGQEAVFSWLQQGLTATMNVTNRQ